MGAYGIDPEVVNASMKVLNKLAKLAQLDGTSELVFENYDYSSET